MPQSPRGCGAARRSRSSKPARSPATGRPRSTAPAADRTHPSGHGRVPLAGHDPVRPRGEGGPYRGIQEAHVDTAAPRPAGDPRRRGSPACSAGRRRCRCLRSLSTSTPALVTLVPYRFNSSSPVMSARCRIPSSVSAAPCTVQLLQPRHPPQVGDPGIGDPRPAQVQLLDVHQAAEIPQALVADDGVPQQEPPQPGQALQLPQALVVHGAIDQVERLEIREWGQVAASHLGILQAQHPEARRRAPRWLRSPRPRT